jgi:hypothetical protein
METKICKKCKEKKKFVSSIRIKQKLMDYTQVANLVKINILKKTKTKLNGI